GALFAGYLTQRETIDRLLDSSAARPPRDSELTSVLLSFGLIWFLVVALGLVVKALDVPAQDRWAAVLTRTPTPDDRYSPEHARYGSAMLAAAGYQLIGGRPLE
ncbi:hypothetical protein ADL35_26355, partial [Streptomyces sp. NRRL WC-3753]